MIGTTPASHPILACAQAIGAGLTEVADVDPCYMTPDQKAAALLALQRDSDRLAELQLRILATAEDVAAVDAARDPAAWLAHHAKLDPGDARRRQHLARALEARWHRLADALRDGQVTVAQAHVIAHALDDLPDTLDPTLLEQVEKHLISEAGDYNPKQLRRLGRKVLEVLDPEGAEKREQKLLEDEERAARKRTWLRIGDLGDGTCTLRGRIPTTIADRLRTYLDAFASPRQPDNRLSAGQDRAPYDVRLGRAFCSLLEHWDPARLPIHGGAATTVMVTIDIDALRTGLGVADTGAGEPITAGEARRLACTASIIPAVLGTKSEVLDLGRQARLFSTAQRRAMALRDKTCRTEGCDIPATWAEAHHLKPWSDGGKSDLKDGVLLCSWHHHRIHDVDYDHHRLPDGNFRFHRRT